MTRQRGALYVTKIGGTPTHNPHAIPQVYNDKPSSIKTQDVHAQQFSLIAPMIALEVVHPFNDPFSGGLQSALLLKEAIKLGFKGLDVSLDFPDLTLDLYLDIYDLALDVSCNL